MVDANLIDMLLPPFVMGVFAVAFFVLWLNRPQFKAAILLAVSYAVGMVAFGLEASYSIIQFGAYLSFFGDVLYTICSALFAIAIIERFGGKWLLCPAIAIVLAASLGHGYYRFIEPDLLMRVRIIPISSAILIALALPTLLKFSRLLSAKLLLCQVVILSLSIVLSTMYAIDPVYTVISEAALRDSLYISLINMMVTGISLTAAVTLYVSYVSVIIEELRMQSETDPLTSLLNRRGFEMQASEFFNQSRGLPLVMILTDIDHFKAVNDIYGHSTGDKVLKHLSGLIRNGVRNSDVCGRIGGEEFCIVLPGAELATGRLAAENIRSIFAQTAKHVVGAENAITSSFGVCEMRKGETYQMLFERADAALYSAKANGRDRVCTLVVPADVQANETRIRA